MKKPKYLIILLLLPLLTKAQPLKTLFPGDTNNDGICNHYDLLPIGLKYNQLFEQREPASLDWIPQQFVSWNDSLPVSHINTGFADCDGNGHVDDVDLDAFLLNYDSIQAASVPPPESWLAKLTDTLISTAEPVLRLSFDKDIAFPGDTLLATLTYSMPLTHPTQALGVALWLTFATENVVDSELRILADTSGNELMYVTATSNEAGIWRSLPPGNIQFAAAARGQNELMGDDTLGCFIIIIEDKIIALAEPFQLECKEALMLNAAEQVIPFAFEKDSVILERRVAVDEPAGVLAAQTIISPNPFADTFSIQCPEAVESISLTDLQGRELLYEHLPADNAAFKPSNALMPGTYLLSIRTSSAVFTKKIQKY